MRLTVLIASEGKAGRGPVKAEQSCRPRLHALSRIGGLMGCGALKGGCLGDRTPHFLELLLRGTALLETAPAAHQHVCWLVRLWLIRLIGLVCVLACATLFYVL